MTKQLLVVDDDALMRRSMSASLTQAGFSVTTAASGEEALKSAQAHRPDLILLDIGLPGMDGLDTLRAFRQAVSGVPVIFVTARRRELDEVVGLELGADDYITKPFDFDVLLAHVKAVLRRASAPTLAPAPFLQEVSVGDLHIDAAKHVVSIAGREIELSPKEFDLLLFMAQNTNRVLSMEELLTQVWGENWIGESQTLYVHIRWLREKIEADPGHPQRLLTVRGVGYKLIG